jgi:hypothetical protein
VTKTVSEAKAILEIMLQNHSQWHIAPLLRKLTTWKK